MHTSKQAKTQCTYSYYSAYKNCFVYKTLLILKSPCTLCLLFIKISQKDYISLCIKKLKNTLLCL